MDFNELLINIISSILIIVRRVILLIFLPYKTVRKISLEKGYSQIFLIFVLVFAYFKFAYFLRDKPYPATLVFIFFLLNFFLTVGFFYIFSYWQNKNNHLSSFIFCFSYSLIPTMIWFSVTSLLYIILPPPRTFSILGKAFSILFVAFSVSILAWKLILFYLSLRFSTKLGFYRIIYLMILYLLWFIPFSFLLYHFKLFRIPFI